MYLYSSVIFLMQSASLVYGVSWKTLHPVEEKHFVRDNEFKYIAVVSYREKFKCLGLLISRGSILTPCDCIGDWITRFEYRYFPSYTQKVTAGTTFITKEEDPKNVAQVRTPYWNTKHPQCMPVMTRRNNSRSWLLYNYGLITLANSFYYDDHVAPWTAVQSGLDQNVIQDAISSAIAHSGECKSLSFAKPVAEPDQMHHRLQYTKINLRPTASCRKRMKTVINFSLYDPDILFFGKFCARESFESVQEECFNNLGAPVICGGLYIGFLGDDMQCRASQRGRYFMYFRLDLAIPFVINHDCRLETGLCLPLLLITLLHFIKYFKVK